MIEYTCNTFVHRFRYTSALARKLTALFDGRSAYDLFQFILFFNSLLSCASHHSIDKLNWYIRIVLRKFMCNFVFDRSHIGTNDCGLVCDWRAAHTTDGNICAGANGWTAAMHHAQTSRRPCSRLWILILSHLFSHTENLHAHPSSFTHSKSSSSQSTHHRSHIYSCAYVEIMNIYVVYAESRNLMPEFSLALRSRHQRLSRAYVYVFAFVIWFMANGVGECRRNEKKKCKRLKHRHGAYTHTLSTHNTLAYVQEKERRRNWLRNKSCAERCWRD